MSIHPLAACFAAASLLVLTGFVIGDVRETYMQWEVHDQSRPKPPVVTPGAMSSQDAPGTAPSDAIIIFDGSDTDALRHGNGDDCKWNILDDGTLEVAPGQGGDVFTRQAFGDVQLHLEWMVTEDMPDRAGQARGNSGVFLMNRYEVQILDCYENESYADGMGWGGLRPGPRTRQRLQPTRAVAGLRHYLPPTPLRRRRQLHQARTRHRHA